MAKPWLKEEWEWFGENAKINEGCPPPPSPWIYGGFKKSIPPQLAPLYEEHQLNIDKMKQFEKKSEVSKPKISEAGEEHFDRALNLYRKGELDKALEELEVASSLGLSKDKYAQALGGIGIKFVQSKKNVDSAFECCLRSVEIDPSAEWRAHFFLSLVYEAKGDSEKSTQEYNEARRLAGTVWWIPENERQIRQIVKNWTTKKTVKPETIKKPKIDEPAVEALIFTLQDKDKDVRMRAAVTLGRMGVTRSVEPLISALQDEDKYVRREAAVALQKIGDPRAIEPLIQAIQDKDQIVQMYAASALDKLGWKPGNETEKAYYFIITKKWEELRALGEQAIGPLLQVFPDKLGSEEYHVILTLGEIGDVRAVEPLIKALKERSRSTNSTAIARALGEIGDARAVEPLIQALTDKTNYLLRSSVASALGKIGDVEAVDPLIKALNDDDFRVRMIAVVALGEIGDARAVDPIIQALEKEGKDFRMGAAWAFARIGDSRGIDQLDQLLKDDNYWVVEAARNASKWIQEK